MRYSEFAGRKVIRLRDVHEMKLKKKRDDAFEKERHELMAIMYGNKNVHLDQLERELDILERMKELEKSNNYDRSHIQKMATRYLSKK